MTGNTGYDVVSPSNHFLSRLIKAGLCKSCPLRQPQPGSGSVCGSSREAGPGDLPAGQCAGQVVHCGGTACGHRTVEYPVVDQAEDQYLTGRPGKKARQKKSVAGVWEVPAQQGESAGRGKRAQDRTVSATCGITEMRLGQPRQGHAVRAGFMPLESTGRPLPGPSPGRLPADRSTGC